MNSRTMEKEKGNNLNIKIVSIWQDHQDLYLEFSLNDTEYCDVKKPGDTKDFFYVLQCQNGLEVYTLSSEGNGIRNLTDEEKEIVFNLSETHFAGSKC